MYAKALDAFLADRDSAGWRDLPFFRAGTAAAIAARIDARVAAGVHVLPPPGDVFNALRHASPETVRVVILGQDPYPTPGNANGFAFSYLGVGKLPASLRNIFKELANETGGPPRMRGDLSDWARQGVLLLNTALTVEERTAGAHIKFGWQDLTRQAVKAVSDRAPHCAFLLWGAKAIAYRDLIDPDRHLVVTSAHPSPLSAHNGFNGSKPFLRVNAWLEEKGLQPVDWEGA